MKDCKHWISDYICSVYECTQCRGDGCKDYKKYHNPYTEMTEEQLKSTLEYQAWKTNRRGEQWKDDIDQAVRTLCDELGVTE